MGQRYSAEAFMALRLTGVVIAIGIVLFGQSIRAADRHVHLRVPPPVRANIASMPQIIDPADAAENRINAALNRLDATVRKAADDCKDMSGKPGDWERSIDVPMRGPGYISFVITDNVYCGGAHPNISTMSIVYDLQTGNPVDWTQLLPASLTGKVALQEGADGTRMVTLASQRLFDLYRAGYSAANSDSDCQHAIEDSGRGGPPAMMAWLDAKTGGLGVQFDLVHVVQACEMPIVIPLATLRAEGAQPALVDAVQKAQQP
jgi:hypothetical protein